MRISCIYSITLAIIIMHYNIFMQLLLKLNEMRSFLKLGAFLIWEGFLIKE
jgi:hypothetical protein